MHMLAKMIRPPPPIPCITLPASSILMLILKAAMSDPKKNIAFASKMIGFRPHISLNFPHVGVAPAAANKYAEPIQV